MRISTVIYALFCMAIVFAYGTAMWTRSSPFAEGGGRGGFVYAGGASGPRHK